MASPTAFVPTAVKPPVAERSLGPHSTRLAPSQSQGTSAHRVAGGAAATVAALLARQPGKRRRSAVQRSATALEEAPKKIAEEAIKAAVASADRAGDPGSDKDQLSDDSIRTSYVSHQRTGEDGEVDEDGLPLVYNSALINSYWGKNAGAVTGRWSDFLGVATPWIASAFSAAMTGRWSEEERSLAKDAVKSMQTLGPTFIKLGQVLSIRPDVLSPVVMEELSSLQDDIATFSTEEARAIIEKELGKSVDEVFSEFSAEPVAAASLAQVYKAKLKDTGDEVAVKVQRPGALPTISRDLYVMRKAAAVTTDLASRFTSQLTDWKALVEVFGEGLYTELDFRNEALNQQKMKKLIASEPRCSRVMVPEVFMDYTTRRVLVSQWVDGTKLTNLSSEEILDGIADAQECFLHQLLTWGFFHGDPHPGNLLLINSGPDEGKLVLLDFGLVAEIPSSQQDQIITAIIHVGTMNWEGLIDDFIALGFLPKDCDRATIIPVMQRVLKPYLKGGGAKAMNFSALGQDLLQATLEIPFSIPPWVSLLARSIATLEGIALAGNPNYRIVAEAYPFVVRQLLEGSDGSSRLTLALRELLLDADGRVQAVRLSALLQAALGAVASADNADGFIDFEAVPEHGANPQEVVDFLLSPSGRSLKPLLVQELSTTVDLVVRTSTRRAYLDLQAALKPRVPVFGALPTPPPPPLPVITPKGPKMVSPDSLLDALQPKLSQDEELYLQSSASVFLALLGVDVDPKKGVNTELSPRRVVEVLRALASQRDDEVQQVVSGLLSRTRGRGLITSWWTEVGGSLRDTWGARLKTL